MRVGRRAASTADSTAGNWVALMVAQSVAKRAAHLVGLKAVHLAASSAEQSAEHLVVKKGFRWVA